MHELTIIIAKYLFVLPPIVWLVVLFMLPKDKRLDFIVFSAIATVVTTILVKIGATAHQDPRPFVRDHVQPYFGHSTDNGFPSDHTTYTSLIAFIILRYNRWLGLALLVVSIAVGTARVISNVHHGQDIVGGVVIAAIGVGLTFAGELAYRRLRAKPEKHGK